MPWKETSAGHFERPFEVFELFYRAMSTKSAALDREHWAISAVVRLHLSPSIEDPERALRHAWKTLRYDHPQIAAYGQGDTYIYEVPTASSIDSWLSETFITEQAKFPATSVWGEEAPPDLAKMYYFPHTSEVLFRSSHWRIDGIGTLHLLNQFLKILAHPRLVDFGDEGQNLCIGMDEVANVPLEVTPETDQRATDLVMQIVNNPSIGLPSSTNKIPGGTARCETKFTPLLTSSVVTRCKVSGFSVTSATQAAVVIATSQNADPGNPADKYMAHAVYDLRKYFPPPYNSAQKAVSIFHTGTPAVIKPSTFKEVAAQFQKLYSRRFDAPGQENIFAIQASYIEKLSKMFAQPPPPGSLLPSQPNFSSLGIIDNYIAHKHGDTVEVTDFWLGVDLLSRGLTIFVWTFQGELKLSACYNKEFYISRFVEEFLASVKIILVEGLGLPGNFDV